MSWHIARRCSNHSFLQLHTFFEAPSFDCFALYLTAVAPSFRAARLTSTSPAKATYTPLEAPSAHRCPSFAWCYVRPVSLHVHSWTLQLTVKLDKDCREVLGTARRTQYLPFTADTRFGMASAARPLVRRSVGFSRPLTSAYCTSHIVRSSFSRSKPCRCTAPEAALASLRTAHRASLLPRL